MNFFSKLWNVFASTPKLTEDIFDKDSGLLSKAGGFLNDLNYTEAEKAKTSLQMGEGVTKFVSTTLQESTAKSQARRGLARMWIMVQLGLILITAACIAIDKVLAKDFFSLATSNIMLWGTGSIIVFYFGGYAWGTYVKGEK